MHARLLAALLLALILAPTQVDARQSGPNLVTTAATLSVLAGAVQRVPSGSSQPEPALDGADLAVGLSRVSGAPAARHRPSVRGGVAAGPHTPWPGGDV